MFEEFTAMLPRIIPLAAVEDEDRAIALCKALSSGGILAVEIAFRPQGAASPPLPSAECTGKTAFVGDACARTDAIARCIARCVKECKDMLVGAGTVTNPQLAELAASSGAAFIVTPGFNSATVQWCIAHNVPVIPGVCTPSDIEAGLGYGLNTLKFFPAEITGGIGWMKAMSGPFPAVRFVATGGINAANAGRYLAERNCAAVCGSWIAPAAAIASCSWQAITNNAAAATSLM